MRSGKREALLSQATTIVENIQFVVTRHFDGRYKNILDAKGYDALAETKTISDVIKNTTDIVKNIKG